MIYICNYLIFTEELYSLKASYLLRYRFIMLLLIIWFIVMAFLCILHHFSRNRGRTLYNSASLTLLSASDGLDDDTNRPKILLVVSHPDDESMFFMPTIEALIRNYKSEQIFVLCLSNGGYDGLGNIRTLEMFEAMESVGVHSNNIIVIDSPELQVENVY